MIQSSERSWRVIKPGVQHSELLPAHTERRQAPQNLSQGDHGLFAHELERHWDPCEAVALEKLSVLGDTWVQKRWCRIVDGYRPGHGPRRRKRGRLKDLTQLRHPSQRVGEALWVHDDWSGNYFHWLTDVLPKLQAWQESGASCRTVLLPQALLKRLYVSESLHALGFDPISFAGSRVVISRLTVIGLTAPTGNFRAALLRRLRSPKTAAPGDSRNRYPLFGHLRQPRGCSAEVSSQ